MLTRSPLRAAFEDDKDGSRLEMPKENDGPKISVQDKVDGIIVKDRVKIGLRIEYTIDGTQH